LEFDVKLHDFEVLKGDRVVSARRSVVVGNLKDAWPVIAEMATATKEAGCRVRVTDETGTIVILIGVATARLSYEPALAA
jgi:hypothetical protein